MNPLKRLATQTALYGISSVLGRFLNYLLVPLLTYSFAPAEYGVVAEFYAYLSFLAVLSTLGLETGYFRFRADGRWPQATVYGTAIACLVVVNGLWFIAFLVGQGALAALLRHPEHPEYILWCAAILAFDAIGALGFARLRAEERAGRFALIKLIEIGVNVALTVLFVGIARHVHLADPDSFLGRLWDPGIGVGYVFIANLAASLLKILLLAPQLLRGIGPFDPHLFRRLMGYSLPMVVIGLAGIVNETLDRAALKYLLPDDDATNLAQLGIYSACYKLSVLMSLFIQAFRYAGEPFFFNYAKERDAREVYALVLNWFVIACVFLFLLVTLYLDVFQYFVGASYRSGLDVVPVLLLANLLLGVYVNLSVWYKLTDRTLMGAAVSLMGAAITIGTLFWLIPILGYRGAAWAHLACYGSMVIVSYALGRRYYPVPYDLKRVLGYMGLGLGLYLASRWLIAQGWPSLGAGTLCFVPFVVLVAWEVRRLLKQPTRISHPEFLKRE